MRKGTTWYTQIKRIILSGNEKKLLAKTLKELGIIDNKITGKVFINLNEGGVTDVCSEIKIKSLDK